MRSEVTAALISAVPATVAAVAALDARRQGKQNHRKLEGIDKAVNGTEPNVATIRDNVQQLVDEQGGSRGIPGA